MQVLQNQKSLDTLVLECASLPLDRNLHLRKDFKVRRLFIHGVKETPNSAVELRNLGAVELRNLAGLIDITKHFQGRIECLSFEGSTEVENFKEIVRSFSQIKALRIGTVLPEDELYYIKAKTNENLTDLVLCHKVSSRALLGVFQIFPNIKNLAITSEGLSDSGLTPKDFEDLHENFNQLKSFVVRTERSSNLKVVAKVLRNITELYIHNVVSHCDWDALAPACVNSEFLSIEKLGDELRLYNVLESFPKLRTFRLGAEIFELEFMDVIRDQADNLQYVTTGPPPELKAWLKKAAKSKGIEELVVASESDFNVSEYSLKGVFEHDYVYVKNSRDALYDIFE